jgi:hypothetical protein
LAAPATVGSAIVADGCSLLAPVNGVAVVPGSIGGEAAPFSNSAGSREIADRFGATTSCSGEAVGSA